MRVVSRSGAAVLVVVAILAAAAELRADPSAGRCEPLFSHVSFNPVVPGADASRASVPVRTPVDVRNLRITNVTSKGGADPIVSVRSASAAREIAFTQSVVDLVLPGRAETHGLEFVVRPEWETEPGKRTGEFHISCNESEADPAIVTWEYQVLPHVALEGERSSLAINVVDPGAEGVIVRTQPARFVVRSNASWRLTVAMEEEPGSPGMSRAITEDHFVLLVDDVQRGQPHAAPIAVAAGPATGRSGKILEVSVGLRLGGAMVAGEYVGRVRVRAELAESLPITDF